MNYDGIQYLDNADAYSRGDWKNAANTYWSPGYPWILAAAFRIIHPDRINQFETTHLINWFIFAAAVLTFTAFLTVVSLRFRGGLLWPWPFVALAFAVCAYELLNASSLVYVTPDVLVAAFVLAAACLLIVIDLRPDSWWPPAALGFVLGLGYLAKAPFVIFTLLAILSALFIEGSWMTRVKRVVILAIAFVVIALPYIAFLSRESGRFTYGESGDLNLTWGLDDMSYYHWQGGQPGAGQPLHPTRRLSTNPPVYEFASPIAGTYPPWYDPAYWNQGLRKKFTIAALSRMIAASGAAYVYFISHTQLPLVLSALVLLLMVADRHRARKALSRISYLWIFALFPLLLYLLIFEPRYIAGFLVILWVCVFAVLFEAAPETMRPATRIVCALVAILLGSQVLIEAKQKPQLRVLRDVPQTASADPFRQVARDLNRLGLAPGDRIALIGDDHAYFWARLAGVQIIAEAWPDDCRPSTTVCPAAAQWPRIKAALATTGARWIVSEYVPGLTGGDGWRQVGSLPLFLYDLHPSGEPRK